MLVAKRERKNQHGSFTSGWDVNTKMNVEEVGHVCMEWKCLAHDSVQQRALVNMQIHSWAP
jgi:hypothetical protein